MNGDLDVLGELFISGHGVVTVTLVVPTAGGPVTLFNDNRKVGAIELLFGEHPKHAFEYFEVDHLGVPTSGFSDDSLPPGSTIAVSLVGGFASLLDGLPGGPQNGKITFELTVD